MRENFRGRGQETLKKVLGQVWDNLGTTLKQLWTILIQLWESFESTYLACKDLADEGKYPWTRSRNTVTDQEEGSTEDWKLKSGEQSKKHCTILTTPHHYKRLSMTIFMARRRVENVLFCVHAFIMIVAKTDQNPHALHWERLNSKRPFEAKPALIKIMTTTD